MTYAIIGFGKIGQALAMAFARKGIAVAVAGRRPPEALAQQAGAIGPTVTPKPLTEALSGRHHPAWPFPSGNTGRWRRLPARAGTARQLIDLTNAFGVPG